MRPRISRKASRPTSTPRCADHRENRMRSAESLKSSLRLCVAHRITVYCPASRDAWLALLAGDTALLEQDPAIAPLFNTLRAHAEFGALGPYRNVYEVSGGHERPRPPPRSSSRRTWLRRCPTPGWRSW